jgi:hypothetical protein
VNPFTPGFGQYPTVAAERTEILRRWSSAFGSDAAFERGHDTLLIGDRGIGKTVLLDALHDIGLANGWLVADVASIDPIPAEQRIVDRLWNPPEPVARTTEVAVRIGPLSVRHGWARRAGERPASLRATVEHVLAGDDPPHGVLVLFDEVHDVPSAELKVVGNQLQLLRRSGWRVAFAGAGLPTIDLTDPTHTPTFLARAWQAPIGPIESDIISETFRKTLATVGVRADRGVAERVAVHTGGLPYAMQLLGWELVESGHRSIRTVDVDAALPAVHGDLISSLRLDYRLSPQQRRFATTVAALPQPARIADVAVALGRSQQQLSPVRSRLIDGGILEPVGHGVLDFTHLGYRAIAASDPTTVDIATSIRGTRRVP